MEKKLYKNLYQELLLKSLEELYLFFGTDSKKGLKQEQVVALRACYGENTQDSSGLNFKAGTRTNRNIGAVFLKIGIGIKFFGRIVYAQLTDPLALLLIGSAV